MTDKKDKRDNLQEIRGIGPDYERALQQLGVLTFAKLAEFEDAQQLHKAFKECEIEILPWKIEKYGWKYNPGNIPSAYLVGYLCGIQAKAKKIKECILDVGILVHKHRVYAAFKGFLDAGIEVPHGDSLFEKMHLESRVNGAHIEEYAKLIQKKDKKKFEKEFSAYIKNGIDPTKITEIFEKTKNNITNKS